MKGRMAITGLVLLTLTACQKPLIMRIPEGPFFITPPHTEENSKYLPEIIKYEDDFWDLTYKLPKQEKTSQNSIYRQINSYQNSA